jgi:ribonuclease P protein component
MYLREEEQEEERFSPRKKTGMLKKEILRKQRDFDRLFKKGKSAGGKYLVLFLKNNGLTYDRHAFLASKKVGNSVKRNRARRLMRESFRAIEGELKSGYDILFIARNTITEAKQQEVGYDMKKMCARKGLTQ